MDMSKVEMFKRELTKSLENSQKNNREEESKLLFQELINRLDTYEEKKELILHYKNSFLVTK